MTTEASQGHLLSTCRIRSDRCSRYTPVPQVAVSDEDEGVYDESPENSQHVELLSSSGSSYNIQADVLRNSILEEEEDGDVDCIQSSVPSSSSLPVRIGCRSVTTAAPLSNEEVRMSCARTVCFFFSIFVCVAYVVSVLWLIPCQLVPCRSSSSTAGNSTWSSSFFVREWTVSQNRTKFTSRPQSVIIGRNGKTVVIVAYETKNDSCSNSTFTSSGVVGLRGEDGKEAWRTPFYTNVVDVICNKTDVNSDTIPDCFVTGTSGLLAAMSASDGETFWYLHNHNDKSMKILAVSSPCLLIDMDLDGDGTEDLAVVALIGSNGNESRRALFMQSERETMGGGENWKAPVILLVSGSTGQTIGRPVPFCCIDNSTFSAHNDTSVVRLSNPVMYDFGNGSRAILVSSTSRTKDDVKGAILLLPIVDLYEEATKFSGMHSSTEIDNCNETVISNYVREIYSGFGSVVSIHVIYHGFERASDILLYTSNGETLSFLNGSNAFRVDWTIRELGNKFSLPTFGFYDNDKVIDVFFTVTPTTCSMSECKSKAIVLSGKNGRVLNEINTRCVAFGPNVIANGNTFLFETPGSTDGTNTLSVSGFTYGNVASSDRYTWSDVRSYGLDEELVRRPIFDKINAVFRDPVPLEPKSASHSTSQNHSDGIEKGLEMLPVRVFAFQNRVGTTPLQIATLTKRAECNASPNMFYSTVLEDETQVMLINIQNEVNGTIVSVTDLKPSLPKENSLAALVRENVDMDQVK